MDLRRRGKLVREKKKNKEEDAKAAKSAAKAWSNDAGLLDFGWPLWWNTVFLPLALFLPPVAVGNAFAGLHKLWAYSYFLVGDDDGKGKNPLPPPEPTFLYYSFGQLPLDLPTETTKRLAALPGKCGPEFASNTALTQVLAPLWSLLLYLVLFALYEYHVRHRRLAKGRGLPATGLPPKDEQRDADVVKEENRISRDCDAVDVQAVYKDFVNQKAVAVNEKDSNSNNAGCCFLLRCCCCCCPRRSAPGEPGINWATKGVTLGIQPGESFGLLGPNGAGKTTLFNLMVGSDDIGAPTSGSVRIMNVDAHEDGFKKAAALLGLAPQFDKLIPYATARQHLRLFSKCCGTYYEYDGGGENKSGDGAGSSKRRHVGEAEPLLVPSGPGDATASTEATDFGERRISRFLREVSLSEKDADRPAEEYSGGMKRKLSVAMTLITDPKVVFLDEMSAGVDIVAQQSLWNKIIHRPPNQTVISTTHSMMEADAVSDRIGILVAGRLKCLGETSRIKSVYGTGYHLELTLAGAEVDKELRATSIEGEQNQTAAGGNAVPGGAVAVQMGPRGGSQAAAKKTRSSKSSGSPGGTSTKSTSSIESKIVASLLKYETGAEVAKVRVLEKMWFTGGKTRLKLVLGLGQSLHEKRALNLAAIFQWILADPLKIIEDHSLGEPTLEQVFLKFAKEQEFIDAAAGNPGVFAGEAEGDAVRRYRRYSENPDLVLPAVEGSEGAEEKEGKSKTSQAGKKTSEVDNMGSVVDGMMTNEGAGGGKAASGTDDNVGDAGGNANGENYQGAAEVVGNDDASDDDADPEDDEEDDDADPDNES
mmetsp:Transcript_9172/g.22484  ORF Transcript_9172/g.22484 Transcript_9172/m.22484 type:complete len:818 (+) Transcript_9172:518-2971(+)|eukprot:g13615.t1